MNKLLLSLEEPSQLQWPLKLAINRYAGPLYHIEHDLPHPGALINNNWTRLVNKVNNFFETYEAYEAAVKAHPSRLSRYAPSSKEDPSAAKVLVAYEEIIYFATEIIEDWKKNLRVCLLPKKRYGEWRPNILNRWEDHPIIACNAIKHDHNFMVSVEGSYMLGSVKGYAICGYVNEAVKPNLRIHRNGSPLSFGSDLRRIFSHLYLISNAISMEVERLFSLEMDMHKALDRNQEDVDFIKKVANFMPLVFHHYKNLKDVALFSFNGEILSIADSDGLIIIPTSGGQMQTIYSGDGYTRSFHIF